MFNQCQDASINLSNSILKVQFWQRLTMTQFKFINFLKRYDVWEKHGLALCQIIPEYHDDVSISGL